MAILSGREKPLANDARTGHLRGANSAADLFDKLPPRRAGEGWLRRRYREPVMHRKRLTIDARKGFRTSVQGEQGRI
jgi:hypothetical protein